MKSTRIHLLNIAVLLLLTHAAANAQVEKVAARVQGQLWGPCAATVEIALRRLEGVADVTISVRNNLVAVDYKPNTSFNPSGIREAVGKVEARVVELQIVALGKVQAQGSDRYFIAGKDRFLLTDSPKVPLDTMLSVTGTADDSAKPIKLKIVQFQSADN